MSTLTITRGLPASGKTTYARNAVTAAPVGAVMRLNRDDFRRMMFGGWTGDGRHEDRVTIAQEAAARELLRSGFDVICDDTNLDERSVERWRALADDVGAVFVVCDFRTVSLAKCVSRNNRRIGTADYVPYTRIRDMWAEHIAPTGNPTEGSST